MALCINQSGTYRNIKTLCINQSGTYRELLTGCINQSGTYRLFTSGFAPALGSSYEGGFLICRASPLRWVVSPYSAEVTRTWYLREDANTRAQAVSGCTGWFVPTKPQLQDPGFLCKSFWGPSPSYSSAYYWSSTEHNATFACIVRSIAPVYTYNNKAGTYCVRAFRCVTY